MSRLNLLKNSSFAQGTSGWQASNAYAIQLDSNYHFYGATALRVTKYAVNNTGVTSVQTPLVTPGLPYAASAFVLVPPTIPATEDASLSVRVTWLNSLSQPISDSYSTPVTVSDDDGWVRISGLFTAPSGAFFGRFSVVQQVAGATNQDFIVDALLFEQSAYVGGYIDNISYPQQVQVVNTALTPLQAKAVSNIQLNADVVLDTLILNTVDEYGVVWVCTDIDGWWGHADPDMPSITRGVDDGSYDVSGRYAARTLTLSGTFLPPNSDALPGARDRLIAATDLVRRGAWLRTNEQPTKAAFVRLSGRPKIETVNVRGRTDFQITLTSGDPIKYHWLDSNPNGFTSLHISANSGVGTLNNIGTSNVPAVFRLVGPMGSGSTIYNSASDQTLTLVNPLRRATASASVIGKELYRNTAILTVSNYHDIVVDDQIVVQGVGYPFDSTNGQSFTVVAEASDPPYTISYALNGSNIASTSASGTIALAQDDVLEIDTYEKSVSFNGLSTGQRSRVATLVDWINFTPGLNTIGLDDNINSIGVNAKSISNGDVTLSTNTPHYLLTNEGIDVTLPTQANLALKALTSNVATLTTDTNHGFSAGDKIVVQSTSTSSIQTKAIASNIATLTTVLPGAFAVGDVINVSLSASASTKYKSFDGSTISIITSGDHGFSDQDIVTLSLATGKDRTLYGTGTDNSIFAKTVNSNNQVTLLTTNSHYFSVGDTVTINLPKSTVVTTKYTDGTTAILTTSSNHNFSNGDLVTIALPTVAALTGNVLYNGKSDYLTTVTTSANHGFAVGDKVVINIDNTNAANASGINGTKVIEAVTATTLTFLTYGPDASSSAAVGANASATNSTNQSFNGTKSIGTSSATPNKFSYPLS